jgi:hypothetical protein
MAVLILIIEKLNSSLTVETTYDTAIIEIHKFNQKGAAIVNGYSTSNEIE